MGVKYMRLIKAFLIGAVGLFVVMTLLSLLIPSTVRVSRTTLVNNTTPARVIEQVSNLSNWKNWHPVFKNSDAKINTISNTSAEIIYGTKTVKVLVTAVDSNAVTFILQSPGENDIQNEIIISSIPNQSTVRLEWRALNQLKWYPWEKFYAIFIDKLTGPGYETSLKGLKDYLESNP